MLAQRHGGFPRFRRARHSSVTLMRTAEKDTMVRTMKSPALVFSHDGAPVSQRPARKTRVNHS